MANNNFNSKYNIGQSVAEGIYSDITLAFNHLESGFFDKAFIKFKSIKGKIPITKITKDQREKFKLLDALYEQAHKKKNRKLMYKIIVKYNEVLIGQLDKSNMYLPSLRDTSQFV